jgi:hypothetical protein
MACEFVLHHKQPRVFPAGKIDEVTIGDVVGLSFGTDELFDAEVDPIWAEKYGRNLGDGGLLLRLCLKGVIEVLISDGPKHRKLLVNLMSVSLTQVRHFEG